MCVGQGRTVGQALLDIDGFGAAPLFSGMDNLRQGPGAGKAQTAGGHRDFVVPCDRVVEMIFGWFDSSSKLVESSRRTGTSSHPGICFPKCATAQAANGHRDFVVFRDRIFEKPLDCFDPSSKRGGSSRRTGTSSHTRISFPKCAKA